MGLWGRAGSSTGSPWVAGGESGCLCFGAPRSVRGSPGAGRAEPMEPPGRPAETRLSRRAEPAGGGRDFLWSLAVSPLGTRRRAEMLFRGPCSIIIIVIIIGLRICWLSLWIPGVPPRDRGVVSVLDSFCTWWV